MNKAFNLRLAKIISTRLLMPPMVLLALSACGERSPFDSKGIKVESIESASSVNESAQSSLTPESPLVFEFASKEEFQRLAGVWMYRQVHPIFVSEDGYPTHGSVLVQGRKDTWHGPLIRLPQLSGKRAYHASAWVKPLETRSSTTFSLVLTRVADGTSTNFDIADVLVEPGVWQKVEGEFVAYEQGGEALHTLHLDVDPPMVKYMIDRVVVADAEYSDNIEEPTSVATPVVTGAEPVSLLRNGSAEKGMEYWGYQGGQISRSKIQAHTGEFSILITGRTATWNAPTIITRGMQDNVSYRISAFTRLREGYAPAEMKLTLKRVTDGQASFVTLATAVATDEKWTQLSGVYTSPNISQSQNVIIYVESLAPEASYYVDTMSVESQQ